MLLLVLIFVFLGCGIFLVVLQQLQMNYRKTINVSDLPKHQVKQIVLADGRLQVDNPKEGDTVGQTFTVSGYAQGWFEATIAVKVFDNNENLLYQNSVMASGDNYGQPAPFNGKITLTGTSTAPAGRIEFNDYSQKDGNLAYQKVVHIKFGDYKAIDTTGWKTYKNDQYGFELQYPPDWNFEMMPRYNKDGSVAVGLFDFAFTHQGALVRMLVSPLGGSAYSPSQLKKTENLDMNGSTVRKSEFGDTNGTYGIIVDQFNNTQYPLFEIWFGPINANEYLSLKDIAQFDQMFSTFKFTK